MKYTNFKTVALMLSASALLALSGCGSEGIPSAHQVVGSVPVVPPVTPPVTPPVPVPVPDAATSTVTASPASVTANGTETSIVTVTVNDASSNPLTDATVTLSQTGTSTISTVINVGDGTYTFNVNSTTVETVTYTATADSVLITQTTEVTFTELSEAECLLATGGYETIVMTNGRSWLDRNLGASEAAANVNDTAAFGDLYQWGRSTDGHQERTSENNDTLASTLDGSDTNTNWYGKFIVNKRTNGDWVESGVDNNGSLRSQSWSTPYDETTNPNQVCPCGYIVPTEQDFRDLNLISDPNAADTFKLAYAPYRFFDDGRFFGLNATAFWTNAVRDPENNLSVNAYYANRNFESYVTNERAYGFSIRCIKPE